ncbi:MAG: HAD-IIB family hydrolase [Spirochaetes bacterium]|nr:HAD-IIB family hydrolase [Spirochaetota bacterium]
MQTSSKYKLISFDLDGTLLNDQMVLSHITKNGLKKIANSDIKCIINSNRILKSILYFINGIKISYISALNGSIIYNLFSSKIEFIEYLDPLLVKEFLSFVLKKPTIVNLFTKKDVFISSFSDDKYNRRYQESLSPKYLDNFLFDEQVLAIELILKHSKKSDIIKAEIKEQYADYINITNMGYNYLGINKKGIDKGTSLEYIANKLDLSLAQTIAIGDSESDLPMIKLAGLGIGMKNADKLLLSYVKNVTSKDNNQNGAIDFILKKCYTP